MLALAAGVPAAAYAQAEGPSPAEAGEADDPAGAEDGARAGEEARGDEGGDRAQAAEPGADSRAEDATGDGEGARADGDEAGEGAADEAGEDADADADADADEGEEVDEAGADEADEADEAEEEAEDGDAPDDAEEGDEGESVTDRDFGDAIISEGGTFWMPPQASSVAPDVDWLFYAITGLSIFCFIGITIAVVYLCIRYRASRAPKPEPSPSHSDAIEITWTVIPSIIVVIIFVLGWQGYMRLAAAPEHAEEIQVRASTWNWEFTYPNGWVDSRLHVPVNRPVRLVMTSDDVLHSLFVPAFRTKMDVVPNRYTRMWFEATEPGTYRIYCAEYCGNGHARMDSEVVVHPPGGYEQYLDDAQQEMLDMPPVELGEFLYGERLGCQQCHSIDGTDGEGPTLKGIWGEERELADGSTVTVDENHIRTSLLEPQERVRAGYDPTMPTFRGRVEDREITALIEFIKSLE